MSDETHEGGDPACWAHLFDDEDPGLDGPSDDAAEDSSADPADESLR